MRIPAQIKNGYVNGNGVYEIDFNSYTQNVECVRLAIQGPAGSTLSVYVEDIFVDTTPRGDLNSNELLHPYQLAKGQRLILIWSIGTGTIPLATAWFRTVA